MLLVTAHAGERLVPWSAGDVHPRNRVIHVGASQPILKSTVVSMIRPVSLFWLPVLLVRGFRYGMFTAVTPLIGTGHVGWSEVRVTSVVGTAQFVAGILGLTSAAGWRHIQSKEIDHRHVRRADGHQRGDVVQRRQLG